VKPFTSQQRALFSKDTFNWIYSIVVGTVLSPYRTTRKLKGCINKHMVDRNII
jgi:hypothetical protein